MGRLLAIDYGEKRIGIAVSDETNKIAFARPYVEARNKEKILDLIKEHEIEKILIGLPKSLTGEHGKSAEAVKDFAAWLRVQTRAGIEFVDERFSTAAAIRELKVSGKKEKEIRQIVDSYVAKQLLQQYLEK